MKKIAIVRRNGLGDLVCAHPLIRYFKKRKDHVTVFVDHRNAALVPYLTGIDAFVRFPDRGNKYWNIFKTGISHRSVHFDLAISAKTSPMKLMNFFLFFLGAEERRAPANGSWHSVLLTHPTIHCPGKVCHQALKALRLMEPSWTSIPDDLMPEIVIPTHLKTKDILSHVSYPILLLSASTTQESNRLSPEKYARVVNRVWSDFPLHAVILSQKNDEQRASQIQHHLCMTSEIHFPRNFAEFMLLLDCCNLMFVGDGGLAHIGAALGKEAIVLFGGINPEEWSPLGKKVTTLYHKEHVDKINEETLYQTVVGGNWMR